MSLEKGIKFTNFNDFYELFEEHQQTERQVFSVSSSILLSSSVKNLPNEEELLYYRVRYACKFGKHVELKATGLRSTKTYKKGCPAFIYLSLTRDKTRLEIKDLNLQHENHEQSSEYYEQIPENRIKKLTKVQREYVLNLLELRSKKKFIQNEVLSKFKIFLSPKDLHNMASELKDNADDDLKSALEILKAHDAMSSASKKTTFNEKWLTDPTFSPWLQRVAKDPYSAHCSLCRTTISLSNMGKQSLTSHMRGSKHKCAVSSRMKSASLKVFFRDDDITAHNPGPSGLSSQNPPVSAAVTSVTPSESSDPTVSIPQPRGLQAFVLKEQITRAEIIWCLHVIIHHHSVRSSASTVSLFKSMFPDSEIASKIQLQRSKIGYTLLYGLQLAPFFHKELFDMCTACSHLVIGFDESHNKIAQKGQMDLSIRFWNSKSSEVCVRYFGSAFLGHATAEDLLKAFTQTLNGINLKKLLQVSMDGPNVNLKFHKDLKTYLQGDPDDPVLMQIGSCGLHSLHNAFKQGMNATDWNVVQILRAMYNLFNHVPARRADYIHYSGSNTFPLKFCAIRWLENSKVAERATLILPNLIKYVNAVKKNKQTPTCNSFKIISTAIEDKMLGPKLSFFQSLASDLEPFLRKFQSDAPLAPLLYESLITTMRNVMLRFVKAEIITTTNDVLKVDFSNKENLIPYKEIDLGYATRDALRRTRGSINDRDILEFRRDCREAMEALCKKLMQRSPLQFRLTRGISFLDPQVAGRSTIRDNCLATTLEIFVEHKWLSGVEADKVQRQFKDLCGAIHFLETLKTFSGDQRLDHFWFRTMSRGSAIPEELSSFFKMIFIFSHGNASLERGFSVNKECLVENLAEESLVAQRQIYDAIIASGGLDSLTILKPLILSARNAHSRYVEELAKRRTQVDAEKVASQERKRAAIKVKELAAKKQKLIEDASREAAIIEEEIQTLRK